MTKHSRISAGVGGTLALEFANTAGWHLDPKPVERLAEWRDVVSWAAEQGLTESGQVASLSRLAIEMAPALELREAIFRVAVAAARGDTPKDDDLTAIVAQASIGLPVATWDHDVMSWRFSTDDNVMPQLLGLIARDAVTLLAGERLRKLRLCAGGTCGWLFIDESRGRPRQWCSMSDCGNRAKARRAYARRRGDAAP